MAVQPSNSGQKVNVFLRVRPLIQREKDAEETVNWYTDDKLIRQYQPGTKKVLLTVEPYAFDQIFGEAATTENVYETAVAPIVEKSLQGFNGTVLCYGQTSSGKTHTMYGSEDEPGIIFLTAQDLFRGFADPSRTYIMKIGFVEVYNEKLTDLLDPEKKQIDIKEVNGEAVPKGLTEIDVYSPEDMLYAARRVQKERKIGETRMNKESSRSHTILRIIVQSTPNDDSEDRQMTNALLNFVDLAGSEKADQSGAVGDRFREATYINKSLTTLSIVVNQLSGLPTPSYGKSSSTMATGHTNAKQSKEPFVSYRGSKLTRILKSSLRGNAYIALICNMTPASVEETHSTLRFAGRAKCIKVDPTKNLGPVTALEYKSKIQDLEKQLNGKSAEADHLRKQLEAVTKFFRPTPDFFISPAQPTAQLHRRRTTCPSMFFAHRTGILTDDGPGDEFKAPKSPARRSLMPTPASQKFGAGNNPPQCSILDKSLDINVNFVVDEPGPPPAKLAKVDAQTWTEFSPPTALQFPPPKSPAPQKQLDRSVDFDPSQSMIDEIKDGRSFIPLERSCEVEQLRKTCENLQAELEELRSRSERPQELKETNTNMIKKLALLSSEVDAAKTERDAAQANMAILESEKEELASGFESLTMKLLDLESDYEDSQGQLANSLQSNVELQSTIESLQHKLDSASRDSTHHSEELAQQFSTVSAELVSLRQEHESRTIQLRTCKEVLARSEAAHESVSEELKALRSKGSIESEKLEAENQELTQQLASVSAELVSIQQQYESTTIQLQACKEVLAHSEAAHESVSKELEALRSKSSTESEQLKTENKELLNQLGEASQKVVTMELELSATRKSRESLHSQLTTVQEELEAIRSAATGSTDHLSKQCEALQCENESLRAERRAHLLETERMELDHQQVTFKYAKRKCLKKKLPRNVPTKSDDEDPTESEDEQDGGPQSAPASKPSTSKATCSKSVRTKLPPSKPTASKRPTTGQKEPRKCVVQRLKQRRGIQPPPNVPPFTPMLKDKSPLVTRPLYVVGRRIYVHGNLAWVVRSTNEGKDVLIACCVHRTCADYVLVEYADDIPAAWVPRPDIYPSRKEAKLARPGTPFNKTKKEYWTSRVRAMEARVRVKTGDDEKLARGAYNKQSVQSFRSKIPEQNTTDDDKDKSEDDDEDKSDEEGEPDNEDADDNDVASDSDEEELPDYIEDQNYKLAKWHDHKGMHGVMNLLKGILDSYYEDLESDFKEDWKRGKETRLDPDNTLYNTIAFLGSLSGSLKEMLKFPETRAAIVKESSALSQVTPSLAEARIYDEFLQQFPLRPPEEEQKPGLFWCHICGRPPYKTKGGLDNHYCTWHTLEGVAENPDPCDPEAVGRLKGIPYPGTPEAEAKPTPGHYFCKHNLGDGSFCLHNSYSRGIIRTHMNKAHQLGIPRYSNKGKISTDEEKAKVKLAAAAKRKEDRKKRKEHGEDDEEPPPKRFLQKKRYDIYLKRDNAHDPHARPINPGFIPEKRKIKKIEKIPMIPPKKKETKAPKKGTGTLKKGKQTPKKK